ncbi:MFS transporter [Salinispora pacifica]|uniref:MFS transporter n=1 Tax=Salinispora pacifica TaxID=351187 RepID=UPI00036E3681|nr:MFS transporter [Salinispora pacifica]
MTALVPDRKPQGALRGNRDFRLLWVGAGVSTLGMRMGTAAYPLLMVWHDGSALAAGLVGFAGLLPMLLVQLPAGALVDRHDRRKVMILSDLVGAVAVGSLAVSLLFGSLRLAHVMAVAFVGGCAAIFYRIAERAAVRHVVETGQLGAALGRYEARTRAAGLLGQPAGSALFAALRWAPFAANLVAHLVALTTLLLIRRPLGTARSAPTRKLGAEIGEGLRWLWRQRLLRFAIGLVAGSNAVFQVINLGLVLVVRDGGGSPAELGLIGLLSGAGGVVGALVAIRTGVSRLSPGGVLMTTFVVWALATASMALTTHVALLGVLLAVTSCAGAVLNVAAGIYQVEITPDHLQGRVSSAAALLSSGANSLGAVLAGVLLTALGAGTTFWYAAGAMALMAVAALLTPAVRRAGSKRGRR